MRVADADKLTSAIEDNFSQFLDLFVDSGDSSRTGLSFVSATKDTVPGDNYNVNITRVADRGYFRGVEMADPSVTPLTLTEDNNVLKFLVDGVQSNDIALTEKTYSSGEELAEEIQKRIDADDKVGARNVTVEWVDNGDTGYLKFNSGTYGSASRISLSTSTTNTAFQALGLITGTAYNGHDVEGTINGEKATGAGQYLIGDSGNATTDGLKIKVTLAASDLGGGYEGTVSYVRGLSSNISKTLTNITDSIDGSIARRTDALQKQVDDIDEQVAYYEERLAARREMLYTKFQAMEDALAQFQSQSSYMTSQLTQISNNWKSITSSSSSNN